MGTCYLGPGLDRIETHTQECEGRDDLPIDPMVRYSSDNGRTWTEFEALPQIVTFGDDVTSLWGGGMPFYDPATGLHLAIWLRQTIAQKPEVRHYNHCFWRLSGDNARTWGEPTQLRYEEGAELDAGNPIDPFFLHSNSMYPGNNIIRHSNGTLVAAGTSISIPKDAPDPDPERKYGNWWAPAGARDIGSACFVGRWDARERMYAWQRSNCVWVPASVSCRGLLEAEVAELTDGRVLVIWRGSDTPATPGRKWFSVSAAGGLTLGEVQELMYDDGSRFYSPSSIHRTIRHSVTGKLYWFGNICPEPPSGNSPRYPLIMAEVDEAMPALKRDTVAVIDDRRPEDSEDLQLSNFSLLENRETHDLELYLTRLGTRGRHADSPEDFWEADHYKYTVTLT